MPLVSSGAISLADIAGEFGGTVPHSMSEYFGKGNAPVIGNAIRMGSHFHGTSNRVQIALTISSNTNNYNIWNSKGGSYAAGNTDVTLTINSGVAVGSAGINSYALDTGTGWNANDTITIINNGTIIGKGGNAGNGGRINYDSKNNSFSGSTNGTAGERGGHALRLQTATSITNNSKIQAGGGGGGGSAGYTTLGGSQTYGRTGNGGGGGAGRNVGSGGAAGYWQGGSAYGGTGQAGPNGSLTAGGNTSSQVGSKGGAGGGAGAAGAAGANGTGISSPKSGGAGGGRGNYITGNSNATWTVTGTRNGLAA